MIREAIQGLVDKHDIGDPDLLVEHYRYPMNGNELAITLARREGWDYGCEITDEFIDDLDCIDSNVRRLHEAAQKRWFEENDIKPPLPIGAQVKQGRIDGISEHCVGCYLIKRPEDEGVKRWLLLKFEDAEAV